MQLTRRAKYADRNLAAIGDEDFVEHFDFASVSGRKDGDGARSAVLRSARDCHTQRQWQQLRMRRSAVRRLISDNFLRRGPD